MYISYVIALGLVVIIVAKFLMPGKYPAKKAFGKIISTLFAMAGCRIEHLNAVWIIGIVISLVFAQALIVSADWRLILPYFFFTLAFYYGGNTIILKSSLPSRAIARFGEQRAFKAYETVVGLMFLNQGLAVGCMTVLHLPTWESLIYPPLYIAVGVALFILGLTFKLWATLTVGVDAYYFRDMFLGQSLIPICNSGPYRFLRNPMYSVGHLQGYGYALIYGSLPGCFAAAAGHFLIYVFFFVAERPFLRHIFATLQPASINLRHTSVGQ